jgi:hypothetical protein
MWVRMAAFGLFRRFPVFSEKVFRRWRIHFFAGI